ncbi:AmmeMemoRadiSam system protein B [Thermodesulforhabdus norvegica]|uniref:AmmeMemoRadiSam system protein B n=1 Tax=Thermodesulforhabdus norvegica TaxID=39841 RepID=A0A1I4VR72_9BACT|nr:AmmeMemoRadiSam system protein B [Thermodesulforhabdus norvegica]SFN03615.1 hypothetical protein SAMN05660836_02410 [Thermodesulforhabdus norvegica]
MEYPRIRYGVEAIPTVYQGRKVILLRDRLGYSEDQLIVDPRMITILGLMDGTNSIRDIQAFYMRQTGELLFSDQIKELVARLDECLFLDNERFAGTVARHVESFLKDPIRHPAHSGASYPEDPRELEKFLRNLLESAGQIPEASSDLKADREKIVGLVVPHIDLSLGGKCYGMAYAKAEKSAHPRVWLIIGTCHEPLDDFFALTTKDFETPMGIVPVEKKICEEIKSRIRLFDITGGEYHHAREHTIEFQVLFIGLLFPEARIVPLLCSFTREDYEMRGEVIDEVVAVLTDLIINEDVGVIASVDLAHVGPRYGDTFVPDLVTVREHIAKDRHLCGLLAGRDREGFERALWQQHEVRRICGASPLFVFNRILPENVAGSVLDVSYGFVDQNRSFVTFAAMTFHS